MPSPLVHLGITAATFIGNSYLKIGGPFQYGTNLLALSSTALVLLRNNFLVPFMFMPSIFMTKNQDHVAYITNARARVQRKFPETCNFFNLTTPDGVTLDAMTLTHPEHFGVPMHETKWLIWCNPNGAAYEELLDFLVKYSGEVGVSVLGFNYRGVAKSKGMPQVADDLVTDGLTAMRYLLDKGVKSKDILLHGHSMGGAVAVRVRAQYPDGPVINDRSFRSLNHAVLALVVHEPALGALCGGLVGSILGGIGGGTIMSSYTSAFSTALVGMIASGFVGYKWGNIHAPIITLALQALQWDLDVASYWNKINGHKVVLYHKLDGVIHDEQASLFSALNILTDKEREGTKLMCLEYEHSVQHQRIESRNQVYHVYSLDTHRSDWRLIVDEARKGLGML